MTMPPWIGSAPPCVPDPPPQGTTGVPCSSAIARTVATSSSVRGLDHDLRARQRRARRGGRQRRPVGVRRVGVQVLRGRRDRLVADPGDEGGLDVRDGDLRGGAHQNPSQIFQNPAELDREGAIRFQYLSRHERIAANPARRLRPPRTLAATPSGAALAHAPRSRSRRGGRRGRLADRQGERGPAPVRRRDASTGSRSPRSSSSSPAASR